ncbi:MAG: hypothetical protein WA849_15145 [Candidatus Udaeobacter sp.]
MADRTRLATRCITADHIMIRVYDNAFSMIETHEHAGDLKEW